MSFLLFQRVNSKSGFGVNMIEQERQRLNCQCPSKDFELQTFGQFGRQALNFTG